MNKTIGIILGVVVVLGVVLMFKDDPYERRDEESTEGLSAFTKIDFDKVAKISIKKGSQDPIVLQKKADKWVVASAWDYQASDETVKNILDSLEEIEEGEVAGESAASHSAYGVNDVLGSVVELSDAGGSQLGRVVVGKMGRTVNPGESLVYVRFGEEDQTYVVDSKVRSEARLNGDVENKSYLQTKIFSLPEDHEIFEARVERPGKPALIVERKTEQVPVPKKEDAAKDDAAKDDAAKNDEGEGEKKESEDEKPKEPEMETKEYFVVTVGSERHRVDSAKESQAKEVLRRGENVAFEEAAEPKEAKEYGLDAPQLTATFRYRSKSDEKAAPVARTLQFGHAIKDDSGEDKSYYFTLDGGDHKGRIYVASKWDFKDWTKELKDFLPEPKKDEKPEVGPAPPPGGAKAPEGEAKASEGDGGGTVAPPPAGGAKEPEPEKAEPEKAEPEKAEPEKATDETGKAEEAGKAEGE